MQTLTTLSICAAFEVGIRAIVPTFEALRAIRWAYTQSPRKAGRAVLPLGTRNFDMVFGAGLPSYVNKPGASWVGGAGTAYNVRVAVATSYAGVAPELLQHLLTADAVDLRRALDQLRDPTLPGLVNVEPLGIENTQIDGEANVYVEHAFTVHYHQATA